MKIKVKSLIEYAVTFTVFCAGQLFLLLAGTPFCVGFAVAVIAATTLTMFITKRYIPGAVFAVMCLSFDFIFAAPGMHVMFYLISAAPVLLIFGMVFMANKFELGLLFSDLLGVFAGYFPFYLAVKYAMPYFAEGEALTRLVSASGMPVLAGFLSAAVITFFAVPAANVITRDGF